MTNNDILKKLRVALKLTDDDIVKIMGLVDFQVSKAELGALFRRDDHPKYMECGDQFLRNFLNGLIIYRRGPMPEKKALSTKVLPALPSRQAGSKAGSKGKSETKKTKPSSDKGKGPYPKKSGVKKGD
jgi:hypothetical protein